MPTDVASQPFTVDLLSRSEYYPFGMEITGLSWNTGNNRYGFGGTHELDNEVKGGVGNHLSFGDFGYDTRVARRWNLDPIDQIFISNYAGFGNNPIYYTDPSGYSIWSDIGEFFMGRETTPLAPGTNGFFSDVGDALSSIGEGIVSAVGGAVDAIASIGGGSSSSDYGSKNPNSIDYPDDQPIPIPGEWEWGSKQDNIKDETDYNNPKSDVDVDRTTLNGNYFFNHYMGHRDLKDKKGKITFIVPPNNEADVPAIGHDRRCRNVDAGSFGILFCEASIRADWKFVKEEMEVASNLKVNFLVRLQAFTAGSVIGILALPKTSLTLLRDRTTDYIWDDYFRSNINKKDGSRVDNLPHPKR